MSQGLTSLPGFYKGALRADNTVYIRKGDDIVVDDLIATNLTLTDGTNDAILNILNGDLTVQADNNIVFDPDGTGNATLTVSNGASMGDLSLSSSNILQLVANNRIDIAPVGLGANGALSVSSNSTSVTLASKTASTQPFYCKSTPIMTSRSVSGSSSGVGVDNSFLGNTQYCTITGASTSLSFSFGSGGNPLPQGGVYDFVLAPASTTGATMVFNKAGVPFYQITATNGVAKWVRIFSDGTNLMPLVPS